MSDLMRSTHNYRRCGDTDLPVDQCAHCRGVDLPADTPLDATETNPRPPAPARPVRETAPPRVTGFDHHPGLLGTVGDQYVRLFESLAAESTGQSNDNAAAYSAKPDPRRAPVQIEVLDLIARIETDLPELARAVCDAMGLMRCLTFPRDTDAGSTGPSPKVEAALATLARHWAAFEQTMPQTATGVTDHLARMAATARRLLGESKAPLPLVTPCPACKAPTIFRVETERGSIAVCGNPMCRDQYGEQRQWTEVEWEDAHDPRFSVYSR